MSRNVDPKKKYDIIRMELENITLSKSQGIYNFKSLNFAKKKEKRISNIIQRKIANFANCFVSGKQVLSQKNQDGSCSIDHVYIKVI